MAVPTTLSEQVNIIKKTEISYRNLHPTAIISDKVSGRNIEIPWDSLFRRYRDILSKATVRITLKDNDMIRLRYNPKLASKELYKTTELWSELLFLNNCGSILDFVNIRTLVVYDPDELKSLLNEILILDKIL